MPVIKLKATGRGRNFSRKRGLFESLARIVYAGGWPARAWNRIPWARRVVLVHHKFNFAPTSGVAPTKLRVAFASDLHIGPLTPPGLLEAAFTKLADARPDLLVLGGDYVFLEATGATARTLESLVAAVPASVKVAVLGNHDLWTDHPLLEQALSRAGVRVLVNDGFRLPGPFSDVAVVGLDDAFTGRPDPNRALQAAGPADVRIAVAHSPEAVPLIAGSGVRLLLCGHTHGGQIASPRGPILMHGKHGRRWPAGLYDVGDMKLFVSRGLGAVELPLRIYAPADVAVFDILF